MTDPADCTHDRMLGGTEILRCAECGLTVPRFDSPADALTQLRATLHPSEVDDATP